MIFSDNCYDSKNGRRMGDNRMVQHYKMVYEPPYIFFELKPCYGEHCEYAFYVYKNDIRIHVEWYQGKNTFRFDTYFCTGCYKIVGFIKNANNDIETVSSKYLFLNEIALPVADADSLYDSGQYMLKGKLNWQILYFPHELKRVFVLCPSAVQNRDKISLPVFHRWMWALRGIFPGNVICLSDPTLSMSHDLRIAWCMGDTNNDAISEISSAIIVFCKSKGIMPENVFFYGSSAGGFTALSCAANIEGSTAIAINSQTECLAYEHDDIELFKKTMFPGMRTDEIYNAFRTRVDMKHKWAMVGQSKAFLVQNILDYHHYNSHFLPFWVALGGSLPSNSGFFQAGRHRSWVYAQEGGHIPESLDMAKQIISSVL